MFKRLFIPALVLTLAACKGGSADIIADRDSRYDLARYNMKPILTSDIKKCNNLMRLGSLGASQIDESLRNAFELSAMMWKNVSAELDVNGKGSKALEKGVFVSEAAAGLKTIFAQGDDVEARSHKCGVLAGELIVQIGLLSSRESIDLAEETNPGIFENMGISKAQLDDLKDSIDERVSNLSGVDNASVLTCVAISQAEKLRGNDASKSSEVWVQVLNSRLSANEFPATGLSGQNAFWGAFAKSGAREITQVDNYEAELASCQGYLASVTQG